VKYRGECRSGSDEIYVLVQEACVPANKLQRLVCTTGGRRVIRKLIHGSRVWINAWD